MSQQINLYAVNRSGSQPDGKFALSVALLVLAGFATMAGHLAWTNRDTEEQLASQAQSIQARSEQAQRLKSDLERRDQSSAGDALQLRDARASLTQRLQAAQKMLADLPPELVNGVHSYAGHLRALAMLANDGVWLTGVNIEDAGRRFTIQGRALHKQQVLVYTRRAAEKFAPMGIVFSSLSIKPVDGQIEFELSSRSGRAQ